MAVFTYTATAIGGGPENGAFCYVYTRGTTTPATTYSDVGRTIPRTNPIVADADGRVPPAYFADATQLTFVVKTANGATTLLQVEYDGTGFFASYVQIDQLTLFSLDYTADGAQTKALTGRVISSPYQLLVAFDGDLQPTDNYTIVTDGTDSTLTWATNCQPASTVRVTIRAAVLQALSPAIAGIDADLTSWGLVTRAAGFDAFAAAPSSANLRTLLTDETGTGSAVFATSPTLVTPTLGAATATSLTLTDAGLGPIFLLVTGQSNTRERPAYSWTPPANLRLWNWDENPANVGSAFAAPSSSVIGTGDSFAAEVARQNPTRMVYYLTIGRNGTPIANWLPSGSPDMYAAVKANVEAALVVAGVSSISGLLWWQGESDQLSATYQTNFESLMTRWRAETWFPWRTPTVIMGVSTYISNDLSNVNGFLVDLATREPDFRAYVHTSSLPISFWDAGAIYLHMTGAGYHSAGIMAAKALEGLGATEGPQTHYTHPLSGDVVLRNASNQNLYHSANDKGVVIYGGNALNQGAGVSLAGATTPTFAGLGYLISGSTTALGWATTGVTLPTSLTVVGAAATQHVVRHAASDQAIVLSGGNSGTSGANVIMSGATAAIPNVGSLNYNATQVANWSSSGFAVVAPLTATTAGTPARFTNTTDSASVQGLIIEGDRATPANNDILYASFNLSDSAGNQEEFARISIVANSVTNSSEAAYMMFAVCSGGTLTNMLRATTTVLSPHVSDGMALGSATLMWGDLFLASGGVVNFNNGDVLITHSANTLAFTGASTGYTFDSAVSISGTLNHTGTSFVSASAGNDYQQVHAAADRVVGISGGTSASNGAAITMAGGSHATLASIGSLTSGGTASLTWGAAVILPRASLVLGAAAVDPVITHAANDRAVKIYGGNAASAGAGIEMTGGTAGLPNIGGLYAGSTRALAWTSTVVVADLPFRFTPTAVASLPAAATAGAGARFFVNNATATTFASIVAGGGANYVPVYSDGTNWRIG